MRLAGLALALVGCGADAPTPLAFSVVTFNVGTTEGLGHDAGPDDGYGAVEAAISDAHYGDGLAWRAAVEDTRAFFAARAPDVVALQEVFHSPECADVPAEARAGFVCETWSPGDPTVAQTILGPGYQVACHLGKSDKCLAVRTDFARFAGCTADVCLDHLAGARVEDCGGGSRVWRAVLELVDGGTITVVSVHGSSGFSDEDAACRSAQFRQVFEALGDGSGAGANGARNVVLGDLNTDPARLAGGDASADVFSGFVGPPRAFRFVSEVGESATPTYGGLVNIDHVVSDAFTGRCEAPGVTPGTSPVTEMRYFDHRPIVCDLSE